MNKFFKYTENKLDNAVFKHRLLNEFVKRRSFKSEDNYLVQALIKIPKDILIQYFHNFFTFAEEKTIYELDLLIKNLNQESQEEEIVYAIEASKIYKQITEKYDWLTANDLQYVLEEIKPEKNEILL